MRAVVWRIIGVILILGFIQTALAPAAKAAAFPIAFNPPFASNITFTFNFDGQGSLTVSRGVEVAEIAKGRPRVLPEIKGRSSFPTGVEGALPLSENSFACVVGDNLVVAIKNSEGVFVYSAEVENLNFKDIRNVETIRAATPPRETIGLAIQAGRKSDPNGAHTYLFTQHRVYHIPSEALRAGEKPTLQGNILSFGANRETSLTVHEQLASEATDLKTFDTEPHEYKPKANANLPAIVNPNDKIPQLGLTGKDKDVPPSLAKKQTNGGGSGLAGLRREKEKKANLLAALKKDIFGQDIALEKIAEQYAEANTNDTGKPKVLVAMGPSGGGKTFTAGKLADLLHKGLKFEVNGNEFSAHKGSLDYQKLWGGKGGKSEGDGSLVNFIKEHPEGFTLIIDEGEKMHPDIWKMFMEIFDKGEITDVAGAKHKVENLWVVITSNRGATRMFPATTKSWLQAQIDKLLRSLTKDKLKGFFLRRDGLSDEGQLPPEVLNRVDEFIPFGPTTREAAIAMAARTVAELNETYKKKYDVTIEFDKAAIEDVGVATWSMSNDARTINRLSRMLMKDILYGSVDDLDLKEKDVIKVKLTTDANGRKQYTATANGKEIHLSAFVNPYENPLLDPEFRERLRNMKQLMGEIVIGQDEVLENIADGILSHYGRGRVVRPFSAFLGGPSGNGKTETGRALAKVLFNDETRIGILSMGNISTAQDFDSMFGSAAQMQGGDIEREFEKILRENPQGAVIVLDELSNMGGKDPVRRAELLYKFYQLFEEGSFVSRIDGTVYELKNYPIIGTGNTGQEHYTGITGDDLLLETWRMIKDRENVRKLMQQDGFPAALINRFNVVAQTKPLLRSEVDAVTRKLWNSQIKDFKIQYPTLEVIPSENLMKQMALTFFTADKGARSVRDVLEQNIGALLLHALLNANVNLADTRGVRLVVDLADSYSNKPYRTSTAKRKVILRTDVYINEKHEHAQLVDLTELTPKKIVLNKENARRVAFHEAGHAIANIEEVTGNGLRYITIRGGSTGTLNYYGYAGYSELDPNSGNSMTRERLIAEIAGLYAGRKAQEGAGFPADFGWSNDLEKIRKLATQYLLTSGLDPEFVGLPVDKEGKVQLQGHKEVLFHQRMNELIREGEALAESRLAANWAWVRSTAAELLLKGEIKRERFLQLREIAAKRTQPLVRRQQPHFPQTNSGSGRAPLCRDLFMRKTGS